MFKKIQAPLVAVLVAILSYYLFPYYDGGDQESYRKIYDNIKYYDIERAYLYYTVNISSLEFGHFLLVWICSGTVEKIYLDIILNSTLAYVLTLLMSRLGASFVIILPNLLFNYYMLILYFAADRLKLALIFVFLSFLVSGTFKKILLGVLGFFSHVQISLLYAGYLVERGLNAAKSFLVKGRIDLKFLLIGIVGAFVVLTMGAHIINKFTYYFNVSSLEQFLRITAFFVLTLYYTRNVSVTSSYFVLLFIAVLLVGGDRVNFIGYCIFMFFAIRVNKGFNIGVIATSIYFFYAGLLFIERFMKYGDGWYYG